MEQSQRMTDKAAWEMQVLASVGQGVMSEQVGQGSEGRP